MTPLWVSKVCSGAPVGSRPSHTTIEELGGSVQQPDEAADVRHSTYRGKKGRVKKHKDDKKRLQGRLQETASYLAAVSSDPS